LNQTDEVSFPVLDPSIFEFNFSPHLDQVAVIPDTAIIADHSEPVSQNPESSFDWMFPPLPLSQSTSNPIQDVRFHGFPQDHTLVFEPSKISCYSIGFPNNTVTHMPAEADKAAKRRKLMEMKEATRRLEAEIAASYVCSPPFTIIYHL
jgi:hypothetical protein